MFIKIFYFLFFKYLLQPFIHIHYSFTFWNNLLLLVGDLCLEYHLVIISIWYIKKYLVSILYSLSLAFIKLLQSIFVCLIFGFQPLLGKNQSALFLEVRRLQRHYILFCHRSL